MKDSRVVRQLSLALGGAGVIALAGAAIHSGWTVGGTDAGTATPFYASGTTKPSVTWGQTMGEEPAAVSTTTTPGRQPHEGSATPEEFCSRIRYPWF